MKKILLFIFLIACTTLQAQVVIKEMFPVDASGTKRAGVIILPGGYDATIAQPVIAFFHGMGEAYYLSDTGTLTKIFTNGAPIVQARDGQLNAVVSPFNGKVYKPIVVALQGIKDASDPNGWAPHYQQMDYFIRNTVMKRYKVLAGGIFVTGLSAGGQETHWILSSAATNDLYAAGFPLSSAAEFLTGADYSRMKGLGLRVWGQHGDNDGTCPYQNTTTAAGHLNAVNPGAYRVTLIKGGGHGAWDAMYNLNNRESIKDSSGKIYQANYAEWFMMNIKGSGFVPALQTSGGTTQPPVTTSAKAIFTVSINGTKVLCDPSGSVAPQSFDWLFSDTLGRYLKPEDVQGLVYGNGSNPSAITVTYKPGYYNITLNVQDKVGVKDKYVQRVVIGVVSNPPPPPVSKVIQARLYVGGVEIVVYKDSNGIYSTDINQ